MKLKFTHKTWYFFLLCAAAASMLNGFAVLGGMDFLSGDGGVLHHRHHHSVSGR